MPVEKLRDAIRDVRDFPKTGILFKDITPVLQNPKLCSEITDAFHRHFQSDKIDGILGIESRGFLFGMMLAQKFAVPFIPVRKKGKLPFHTISHEYSLEYGTAIMEMHTDAMAPGSRILIHDDLLATGGTASAAAELVRMQNAEIAGFAFLVGLDFLNGAANLKMHSEKIISLVNYD
ncbi:MAG: adenine phosphoribosyltransferase [Bacteroidetes bacterium]|nr:MAG: adenine phosphoribosyltransferase [Bacteroidota bacterium]REK05305.1 MAG: adenine phosphoribosyltransferase [Bacteroidota bacterium]REK32711.1 MAG: adenine phosphoribosyltransferase [Bacteroidota bacterium]REK48843.1 MAG: adenine phosphoribosyltransferase [Bacteroidota bacterium]